MLMALLDMFPKQPALPCQGSVTCSTGSFFHSGFLGEGKPISEWQPLALSSSYFPHLLFSSLSGKDQNVAVGYTQKKPPLWRKKSHTEIATHLWTLPN